MIRHQPGSILLYQRVVPDYKASLIRALAERFDMCVVHAAQAPNSEVADVSDPPFRHLRTWRIYLPGSSRIVLLGGLLLPLRQRPEAVIYEGSAGIVSNYLLVAICRWLRVPVIAWTFGFDPDAGATDSSLSDRMRLWLFAHSDSVVTYWEVGAKAITSLRPQLTDKVFTAPNVVGPDLVEPLWSRLQVEGRDCVRSTLGFEVNALVLVFLGRLVAVKQVDRLLSALKMVSPSSASPVICVIAGDGPLRAELERRAEDAGVDVRFVGHVRPVDAGRWLYAADAMVIPGRLGLAVAHAAAFGCPTVSIRVDGPFHGEGVEHLVDGVTGRWVEGDSGLAALVQSWSRDRTDLARLRRTTRSYYESRLSPEATLAGFERAINKAKEPQR